MLLLNMFEETLVIVSIPIDLAPLMITYKAFLFHLKLPILLFNILGLLFIKEYSNYQAHSNKEIEKCKEKYENDFQCYIC